jgi:hypothetical protein
MGWTGFYPSSVWDEKEEMTNLHKPHKLHKLLKVGSIWFGAFEPEPDNIIISVILTKRYKGEFMYKTMDETMGPALQYCRCPRSILKLSTQTDNYSIEFLKNCEAWHNRSISTGG